MIKREISESLRKVAKDYSVITVIGPRQSGKTTLVKDVFANKSYTNLEDLDNREYAIKDPRGFLSQFKDGAIIDEIQRAPDLLSYIQTIVDNDKRKGLFILTGSHQISLKSGISQSLAGRIAIIDLLPLTFKEINNFEKKDYSLDKKLLYGCYPRIYDENINPTFAYKNYIRTYIERDLYQLIAIKELSLFQKFLKLCAGRIGAIINKSSLSNEVGVSSITIESWFSILEDSKIIFRLQPYFENFGKRVIKSPKLYFIDTGLASFLLGIENEQQMSRDPLRGSLVENMVFLELVKARFNKILDHNLYYFRDSNGNEVDFIYKSAQELSAIEVKSAKTIQAEYFKGLEYFKEIAGQRFASGYLIYSGKEIESYNSFKVVNYQNSKLITG